MEQFLEVGDFSRITPGAQSLHTITQFVKCRRIMIWCNILIVCKLTRFTDVNRVSINSKKDVVDIISTRNGVVETEVTSSTIDLFTLVVKDTVYTRIPNTADVFGAL